ncbi:helix-turn-helix domain-containing protein [Brevibacillus ruminantium]|uniref:Helix-turn-helix domain-containing protein n=1 Tax=Brevibacillus ruminantium TaxID=2950604 RepID=A0ABY4WKY5_9BACL|nr:helix-turn-helix domain-containing protein [Brevibacillus ruminantium]USG67828.1 helix-turn-helix domain-containing protein [Brevibacillus ruminantium]
MSIEAIGELVLYHRQQKNISLGELAERTGVSKASLSKIESGETKRPSFMVWKKIASTLNIPYTKTIGIYLSTTEQPTKIKLLLEESIALNSETLVQKAALRLLETPRMDTLLALDHLLQVTKGVEDRDVRLALYGVIIDYTRKHGIPYYLAKNLYERYLLERDDFIRFEETYRRGKEFALHGFSSAK